MLEESPYKDRRNARWTAALLLLPALALAWPGAGGLLRKVFASTELIATAVAVIATIPMAVVAVLGGGKSRPRRFALWYPCLLLAMFAPLVPGWELHDTLEASRGQWMLFVAAAATFAGASVSAEVRPSFLRGSILLSLMLTLWALFGPSEVALAGILGNTGELASAALFGAVVGARALREEQGAWRVLGGAAFLAFAAQAAAAPSIANVLAFLAALLASALLEPGSSRDRILRVGIALLPLLCLALLKSSVLTTSAPAGSEAPAERVLGGVGVRASIGKATLSLIGDQPFLGTGPGQFVVEFPPYRDLDEIEASTNRADGRYYTEVEHPHQDGLLLLSEFGLLAGGALLAFGLLAGLAALRLLRAGESGSGSTVACGVIAVLAGSLVNAPLGMNPAAAVPAFVALGMVTAARVSNVSRTSLALPAALLLLLLFSVPRSLSTIRLGLALSDLGSESANVMHNPGPIHRAAEACPDSVVARGLQAQWYEALDKNGARALREWQAVLELRPYRVEALLETARLHALQNEYATAIPLTRKVLELDPEHPTALRNLARFEFYAGRIQAGEQALDAVEQGGLFTESFGLSLASGLFLSGMAREAQVVLERVSPEWAGLDGDRAWVEAGKRRNASDERFADALESHAHRLWARDLAAGGNASRAIAVYRQNLRITRDYVPEGPLRIRMELCAAQWLAGRKESATESAAGLEPQAADWASLPAWAGTALRESRLFE